jgi:hypothetical protein
MTLVEALLATHTQSNVWSAEKFLDGRLVQVARRPEESGWMIWWYVPYFQAREEDEGTELCGSLAEVELILAFILITSTHRGWNAIRLPSRVTRFIG